jgi:sugar lactone lactonase YvrE
MKRSNGENSMAETLSDIVASSTPERLATGCVFTEGPLWHPDGYLLFVDIRHAGNHPCEQRRIQRSNV